MTDDRFSTEVVRDKIHREVERVRTDYQQALADTCRFTWLGEEIWIDRRRWLPLHTSEARGFGAMTPTAVSGISDQVLTHVGCRKSLTTPRELVEFLAYFLVGPEHLHLSEFVAVDFLRFAVVQPILNPAFAPLFWLAMDREMRPIGRYPTLGLAVGTMAYDLSWYPASRAESPQVREAQIEFVRELGYGGALGTSDWHRETEDAWTSFCVELHQRVEAGNFFWNVGRLANEAVERTHSNREFEKARARLPKDTFEVAENGRFACSSFSMRPPHEWRVELDTHDITIPGADHHMGSLSAFEMSDRAVDSERLVEVASSLQTRFKSDAGEPVRAEVTELVLAGQPAAIARMSGRFTSPAAFGRDEIDWPDHMVINAVVRSPRGYWEIMLRGDRNFVEANEAKFMQMLETLAPR